MEAVINIQKKKLKDNEKLYHNSKKNKNPNEKDKREPRKEKDNENDKKGQNIPTNHLNNCALCEKELKEAKEFIKNNSDYQLAESFNCSHRKVIIRCCGEMNNG